MFEPDRPATSRHPRAGHPEQSTPDTPDLFYVLVAPDGTATVNGRPLPPTDTSVQTAVLDALHRHAQVRDLAVDAAVLDQRHQWALRLRVRPDGGSELVEERHAPVDEDTTVLRRRTGRPAAVPQPDQVREASASGGLTRLVADVNEALTSGNTAAATERVAELVDHAVRSFGPAHAHTLEAHALEAHVAYLAGDHERSTAVYLGLARYRYQQGDPRVRDDVARATAAWYKMSTRHTAARLGQDLLSLLTELAAAHQPAQQDLNTLRLVRQRLAALSEPRA